MKKTHEDQIYENIYTKVFSYMATFLNKEDLLYLSNKFSSNPVFLRSICLIPKWYSESLAQNNENIELKLLVSLGEANLEACFAYTMYDYLRDGKIETTKTPSALSIANILIQKSITTFMHLSPSTDLCVDMLEMCHTIDAYYLRNPVRVPENKYSIQNFDSFSKNVFKKSIGMAITPLIVACLHGHNPGTKVYKQTFKFFKHYLTARQLSDDTDDFKKDLTLDIFTPATLLLDTDRYSPTQIRKIMRTEVKKHFKKSLRELLAIPNFNHSTFRKKYVVKC